MCYLQNAGDEWSGKNRLQYAEYLIWKETELKDSIAFANSNELSITANDEQELARKKAE